MLTFNVRSFTVHLPHGFVAFDVYVIIIYLRLILQCLETLDVYFTFIICFSCLSIFNTLLLLFFVLNIDVLLKGDQSRT